MTGAGHCRLFCRRWRTLPDYSFSQCSLTVRALLNHLTQIESKRAKSHTTLQDIVDREIQKTGFLLETNEATPPVNGNSLTNGKQRSGDGFSNPALKRQ